MRIAFLLPDFRVGGAQHMVINMANEFARRGHDIQLWVVQKIGPMDEKITSSIKVICFEKKDVSSALFSLAYILRNERIDILYTAMSYMNIVAILARLIACSWKTTVVISERNYFSLSANGKPPSFVKKSFVMLLYPLADCIMGISKGVAEDIKKYLIAGKQKVSWIYNPVVTPETLKMLHETSDDPWFDTAQRPVIVTAGRLVEQKDQQTLLKAFAKMRNKKPASLILLGEGPMREDLQSLAQELGISQHVYFKGFVKNTLAYMKRSDLFVISSAWEGFCNVIVEALLCGLPIVSTDCPSGPSEILGEGKYGLLTEVGNAEDMSDKLIEALEMPLSKNDRIQRAMDFSVEKICDVYEDLFKKARTA